MLFLLTIISQLINLAQPLILMPLAIQELNYQEISIWLFFSTLISFSKLIETSLSNTFIRAYSYYMQGFLWTKKIVLNERYTIKSDEVNKYEIYSLFKSTKKIYFCLILFSTVGCLILSYFFCRGIYGDNIPSFIIKDISIFIISLSISFYDGKNQAFWRGTNRQNKQKILEFSLSVCKLSLSIYLLILGFGLLAIAYPYLIFSIASLIVHFIYNKKDSLVFSSNNNLNKLAIKPYYSSINRYLIMSIGGFSISNISSIISSNTANIESVAAYLFTLRIVMMIKQFTIIPTTLSIPLISSQYSKGKFSSVRLSLFQLLRIQYWSYLILSIIIIFFGRSLFEIFSDKNVLLHGASLLLLLIYGFLEMQHVTHAIVYEQKNHVPTITVLSSLISAFLILSINLILSIYFNSYYGVFQLILVPLIVQLIFNNWYPIYINCRDLKFKFFTCLIYMIKPITLSNLRFIFKEIR